MGGLMKLIDVTLGIIDIRTRAEYSRSVRISVNVPALFVRGVITPNEFTVAFVESSVFHVTVPNSAFAGIGLAIAVSV
jgi:hypothetical protein